MTIINNVYLPAPMFTFAGHPHDPSAPDDDGMDEIVNALMVDGAEFEPYSRANLCEALGELPDDELIALGRAIRDEKAEHVLVILRAHVEAYWERLARMHAEKLVRDNAHCRVCHGAGCICCDGGFDDG